MAIPGGQLPCIATSPGDGTTLVGAVTGTSPNYTLSTCYKAAGDAAFSAPVVCKGVTPPATTPTTMSIELSGIGLCRAAEGPGRWVLTLLIKGETATSEWWSADFGKTFTRIPTH